jgi:hypothetical protein
MIQEWQACHEGIRRDLRIAEASVHGYAKVSRQLNIEERCSAQTSRSLNILERVQSLPKKPRIKSEEDRTEGTEPRWYFGTFTQPDTNTEPHEILKNTAKLIKSKMVSPIEWCYSLELQQSGTPHTHYAFLTHKYPEYKKIHAFNCSKQKILQRSRTEPARNAEHAIRYVLKTDTKPDANWLAEHNLSQTEWLSDNCPQPA